MARIRVKAKLWTAPIRAAETVDRVSEELVRQGWGGAAQVVPYGVGDTVGVLPRTISVHFDVDRLGATQADAEKAVKTAAGGGYFGAWSDFSSAFLQEVVVKSAADTADLAKKAGKAAADSAFGIGIGLGTTAALIAVGAGVFLAWRYLSPPRAA